MRPFHFLLGTAVLLGATALQAQEHTIRIERAGKGAKGDRVISVFTGDDSNRAVLGITTRSGGVRDTLGVLVISVTPGGPADSAGIQEGDRIASVNGVNLALSPADTGDPDMRGLMTRRLVRELHKVKPGTSVDLKVYSDGRFKTMKVKTVAAEDLAPTFRFSSDEMDDRAVVGLGFGGGGSKRDTLGLLVTQVASDGPAEKAGIVEGDRIQAINGVSVRVPKDEASGGAILGAMQRRFTRELAKVKAGDPVQLSVYSNGSVKTVTVKTARSADVYPHGRGAFRIQIGDGAIPPIPPLPPIPPMIDGTWRTLELDGEALPELRMRLRALTDEARRAMRNASVEARLTSARADALAPLLAGWGRGARLAMQRVGDGVFAFSGLRLTSVSDDLATYFGRGAENGLLVLEAHSPWDALKAGDVILSVNGKPVRHDNETSISVDTSHDTTFEVLRKGKKETIVVKARRARGGARRSDQNSI
ncbi:MAG: PDZ domain-containing protein [Gemmatimonadaceae bacterium]|nr:PDZ domain-containing protein [Gemmatimonadaceae bacterium]